ncbi:MAG: triple tyrosine motif-containing protein [Bacteroidota bacterium]
MRPIELGTSRELTLTNLDYGNYTLRVRGTNEYGRWSEQEAALHLQILPPWWKTKLAYITYFLIVAGISMSYSVF